MHPKHEERFRRLIARLCVHSVWYNDSPQVRFSCDHTWAWPSTATDLKGLLSSGIHAADMVNGEQVRLYSFNALLVTCPRCVATLLVPPPPKEATLHRVSTK